jgi:hypothetical protein
MKQDAICHKRECGEPDGMGLRGSPQSIARAEAMISEWENTRSGRLEELAFLVMSEGITLDAALARIDQPNAQVQGRPATPDSTTH